MTPHPPSPSSATTVAGHKRRHDDRDTDATSPSSASGLASSAAGASAFRNVSACNRCRLRKNRCDQNLPACSSCEKAGVKCVGYDPITKREIPRSYVYYLEQRVSYLEHMLRERQVEFIPAEDFALGWKPAQAPERVLGVGSPGERPKGAAGQENGERKKGEEGKEEQNGTREKLNKLVSNIGMVSVQGTSDPRYLGSTSGISFARVVFAAVKSSVSTASSERGSKPGTRSLSEGVAVAGGTTTMRDSFFGLHTKPRIKQAPFPDRELGLKLVELYFEHANPQIPILHRGEFMQLFERTYSGEDKSRTPRESYMLNIVFAIGAGTLLGSSDEDRSPNQDDDRSMKPPPLSSSPTRKRQKLSSHQHQPEEYHASAIVHLESFLGSSQVAEKPDGSGGGLEELQAVLLLAGFALLRPVAPGLWYIVGVAVRLAVDLGLHYEDGVALEGPSSEEVLMEKDGDVNMDNEELSKVKSDAQERGRREWVRDFRRRLWWCVYSFDRLVSTCVGRPFGITDQVVTTDFPSPLDDKYITRTGFRTPPPGAVSYKLITYHYVRLRLLQSEILQVLQYRQAQQARATGASQGNEFMHTKLPSPFLAKFESFRAWRRDIDRRLWEWKESAPTQSQTGVNFNPLFLDLNYWQAVIMLYRQSLTAPPALEDDLKMTYDDVQSPSLVNVEAEEDEQSVFLKVAEAGQKTLKIYRQLHRFHLVNYTFLATHHLFMAGISFLYAIWHSPVVRSYLTLDDVDFTVLAATSVLGDLVEKCPPAEACRDAFDRMSKATIQMCLSTTGFGSQASGLDSRRQMTTPDSPSVYNLDHPESNVRSNQMYPPSTQSQSQNYFNLQRNSRRPPPRFDMDLRDLFSDTEQQNFKSFTRPSHDLPLLRPSQHTQIPRQAQSKREPSYSGSDQQQQQPHYSPSNTSQHTFPAMSPLPQTSPVASTRNIDPALTAASSNTSPQQQGPMPYSLNNSAPYANFTQTISSTYPDLGQSFTDLDFLDNFTIGAGDFAGNTSSAAGGAGEPGMDLGFGMGTWPGENGGNHDWSEGNGFDLFDGFFFGGVNGAGGV